MSVFETYRQRMKYAAAADDAGQIKSAYFEAALDPAITMGERSKLFSLCRHLCREVSLRLEGGAPA